MDKSLRAHQTKSTKQIKPKVKPIKVVYISNPMKVKTSASEFRALVQELTGQDSDMCSHGSTALLNSSHGKVPGGEQEAAAGHNQDSKLEDNNARIWSGSDVINYEGYGGGGGGGGGDSSSHFDMAQVMGTGLYCSSDLWC